MLIPPSDADVLTITCHYRDRADSENNFDKLKNQWGWSGYTTRDLHRCRLMARMIALIQHARHKLIQVNSSHAKFKQVVQKLSQLSDFFKTLNIKILEGRTFSRSFPNDTSDSFIINKAAADMLGFENPIGKEILRVDIPGKIIGVSENFHVRSRSSSRWWSAAQTAGKSSASAKTATRTTSSRHAPPGRPTL